MNRVVKKDSAAASQKKKNDRIHEGIYQINTEPCDDDLQSTSSAHNDTAATKADDVGNDEGKTNNDNDSFYGDWVLYGNNNNINSNSNNDDDDHKRQHKSQIATQSRSATKKDKENSKGDGPTNRKRTRDQSDDEESCDDTDDSNIDHEDDEDDEDDDDDEDEDECLPENNTNFCSNQNNDSKSPVVGGKRGIKWMKNFQRLVAYKKVHNNTMVPSQYDQDPSLGRWVCRQRENHRNDDMISNRLALLNSIDFEWDRVQIIRKVDDEKWMQMFQKLVAYKEVHTDTMVPSRYDQDPSLGRWVRRQRENHRNDNMISNRLALLNSIDFEWDGVQIIRKVDDTKWMQMFQRLIAYKKVHNNTMVPSQYDQDPSLGRWVCRQRENHRNDDMISNRLALLNSIDFEWDRVQIIRKVDDEKWMQMFQKLVAYKEVHTDTMVPQQYKEDPPLGRWVGNQRNTYRNDDLLPSRVTHLNSIDFKWEVDQVAGKFGKFKVDDEQWMKMFQKLVAYKKAHKHTLVPTPHKEDPKLGRWVSVQRHHFKKNELLKERLDKLDSIGFVWKALR